ncbi:MAG: trypsin-like peptidase domain-containing protein [Bacteriovoracaceae bacterium]|nr:trypsin-like peptidase domain-containing protein [Bacteriovoracaceae bacterium]
MKILLFVVISLWAHQALSFNKVIYGVDNRQDIYQLDRADFKDWSNSTAALVHNLRIRPKENGYLMKGKPLQKYGYCSDERFVTQPTPVSCTGFLVGEDLLVTAGHCILAVDDCRIYKWVFGYKMKDAQNIDNHILDENVYRCVEVIERTVSQRDENDYILLRLDRKVEGRKPLAFRSEGVVSSDANLVVIGHPFGLPLKVADGGRVRSNYKQYSFVTTLDAYHGNSGSPVIDEETGIVEGILVKGEDDFVFDSDRGCKRSKVCGRHSCDGETVTRITAIKSLSNLRGELSL